MVTLKGGPMQYIQFAVPLALIFWFAIWPFYGRARWVHIAMTIAILAAIILLFPWLWPSAYAPLGLIALLLLAILFGRRRPVPRFHSRVWPTILAAGLTIAATVLAAGLATARLRPAAAVDLAPPFASAMAITEGGARAVINRHRAVLDPASPSLSSWRGTGHAVSLYPVDRWGRPLTRPQPVLAPCAGRVMATGDDPRLGRYVLMICDGNIVTLSGLSDTTASGAIEAATPLGTASSLTLHAQTPGTPAHPFSGDPFWITLNGSFPVRGLVLWP
jgi:hypothetical protein